MHTRNLLIAGLLCLAGFTAQAHDAWVESDAGIYRIVYGHGGDSKGADSAKVKDLTVYTTQGETVTFERQQVEGGVLVKPTTRIGTAGAPVGMITMVFDNGYWTTTANGKSLNEPKQNHPDYLEAFRAMKYGKSLFSWSAAAAQPKGLELEIVPLENPFKLAAGKALPVQVFHQGQPLANAPVRYGKGTDNDTQVMTNAAGQALIPLQQGQPQVIAVGHRAALTDDPNADALTLAANLYLPSR